MVGEQWINLNTKVFLVLNTFPEFEMNHLLIKVTVGGRPKLKLISQNSWKLEFEA